MHAKLQTSYAKRILKKRSSTVEPVLGTLSNFLNLKRVNARGIKQANKHVMMAAIVYNLKKYVNYITRQRISVPATLDFHTHINKMSVVFNILILRMAISTGNL